MKILLITQWKPSLGGIVTHVENLIEHSKNTTEIITYKRGFDFPLIRPLSFILLGFFQGIGKKTDLIHAHYLFPQGFLGALLKTVIKKPLVITLHGSDVTGLLKRSYLKPILSFTIKSADRLVTVSDYLKDELLSSGIRKEKISVVKGGILIPEGFEKSPERRVLFVGGLVPQKDVSTLLQAFSRFQREKNDYTLDVVGGGALKRTLEKEAHNLGINVKFHGYQEDLNPFFKKAEILVLPSIKEGLGLIVLEAMARRIPVVASRTGGIPEIVTDGKNGLLFEPGNYRELAENINRIVKDRELAKSLAAEGKETAKEYRWENTAEKMDRIYKEVSK